MKWYDGDISSAISTCQSQNSALVVHIRGTDDGSDAMDELWVDQEIAELFSERLCVPLRLDVSSTGGAQFSQIYPVSKIPSTYFIGSDGRKIAEIQGACQKEELKQTALQHLKLKNPAASLGAAAAATGEETEEEINANASYSTEEKEAKIERARELIKLKQQRKAEEETEKSKNAEIERRRLGKDMNKLKEFKAEQEAKETRDALRKEKEETRIAKEKVKEQIQRDREARNAKYMQERTEKDEALRRRQQEKLTQQAEEAARITIANSSNARIQFRLPDGSKIFHSFEADEAFQAAYSVVAMHASNPLGKNFRLATIVPRQVFTSDDYQKTFRELSLVPTRALIVLPPTNDGGNVRSSPAAASSPVNSLFSFLFTPFTILWNMINSFLFATPNPPIQSGQAQQQSSSSTRSGNTAGDSSKPQRRQGRLTDLRPDDDDQNTWNGNSTQQM